VLDFSLVEIYEKEINYFYLGFDGGGRFLG